MASWMDTKPIIEAREILSDLDTFNPNSPDVVGRVEVAKLARSLINVIEDQQRQIGCAAVSTAARYLPTESRVLTCLA